MTAGWARALVAAAPRVLTLGLVATGLVEALGRTPVLRWADAAMGDLWVTLAPRRQPSELPVVVIAIDDASLQRNPDPLLFWGSDIARAIEVLRDKGSIAVGLDLNIATSGETWLIEHGFGDSPHVRSWDGPLRGALASGDVVLATQVGSEAGGAPCVAPAPELTFALPSVDSHLGYVNLGEEDDGVLRSFRPVVARGAPHPSCPRLHFAMQLALRQAKQDPAADAWALGERTVSRDGAAVSIVWAGPRGTFPTIPFWKLAAGEVSDEEAAWLRDRIAIIGADHAGTQDLWVTPFDRFAGADRRRMAGVEVQANAMTTLVSDLRVRTLNPWVKAAGLGLIALVSAAWSLRTSGRASALGLAVQVVAWPAVGYAALVGDKHLLLPGASAIAVAVATVAGANAFRLVDEVRERRRVRAVFGTYVANDVVEELLADPARLALGGTERQLTVLFVDIRGFTSLSEALSPEEVIELLNAYFQAVCPPIRAAGGRIDKFIGDAVMAVFNAPTPVPEHALAGCQAALGLAEAALRFRAWVDKRFPGRGLPPFDVGVGVHTGAAVVGNIGFDGVREYAVIGDTVNTASRLEGLTKELGARVLISEATRTAAGPRVRTSERHEVQVRGRRQTVAVFGLLGVDAPPPPQT